MSREYGFCGQDHVAVVHYECIRVLQWLTKHINIRHFVEDASFSLVIMPNAYCGVESFSHLSLPSHMHTHTHTHAAGDGGGGSADIQLYHSDGEGGVD